MFNCSNLGSPCLTSKGLGVGCQFDSPKALVHIGVWHRKHGELCKLGCFREPRGRKLGVNIYKMRGAFCWVDVDPEKQLAVLSVKLEPTFRCDWAPDVFWGPFGPHCSSFEPPGLTFRKTVATHFMVAQSSSPLKTSFGTLDSDLLPSSTSSRWSYANVRGNVSYIRPTPGHLVTTLWAADTSEEVLPSAHSAALFAVIAFTSKGAAGYCVVRSFGSQELISPDMIPSVLSAEVVEMSGMQCQVCSSNVSIPQIDLGDVAINNGWTESCYKIGYNITPDFFCIWDGDSCAVPDAPPCAFRPVWLGAGSLLALNLEP